jgi:GNAT superfamily N-acetyltransferase
LCKLYYAFHEYHAAGVPDRLRSLGSWGAFDVSKLAKSLQLILKDREACILVAEINGNLAGFVEVYLREDKPDPARTAYRHAHLQSLMVVSEWRMQGIGKQLIRAAEVWGLQNGASEMRLDTWMFPGDPVSFYEHIGYRTLKRELVRRL